MVDTLELILASMVGFAICVLASLTIFNDGRSDCERKLPRNESCVRLWVTPEQAKLLGATK